MGIEAFRFDGKTAVVVGGATGMGAAAATIIQDLGAEVTVMDYADVDFAGGKSVKLDLRDKASIDDAVDAGPARVDVLLSCAGVADGTAGIEKVNFIGHRHFIDRLLERDMLPRGSAIGMISSAAGLGWENNLPLLKEYLATPDFDAAAAWIGEHPEKADYMWSKQTINAYVAQQAYPFLKRGIRINAILPGPTDTPLARGERGGLARVRHRLPPGHGHRGVDPRGAGVPARLPVQRGRPLHHGPDDRHRRRLHQRRGHRHVRVGKGRHRLLLRQVLTAANAGTTRR